MNVELLSPQHHQMPQGPGLSDYLGVVKRRVWHVIVPVLVCAVAGFGVASVLPKEYRATTEVVIEDPDSMVGSLFLPVGFSVPHKQLLTTIRLDIARSEFLVPLVEQYGITEGYNPSDPRDRTRMYEKVRKRLQVTWLPPKSGPDFIGFSYEGRDSVRVTEFVNAARDRWRDDFMARYRATVAAMESNIKAVYEEAKTRLADAENDLKNFQDENGADYFGKDPGGQATAMLLSLTKDLETYETNLRGEESALRTVTTQLETVRPITQSGTDKIRNPEWIAQSAKIDVLESQIKTMELEYTDSWPKLKTAKELRDQERKKLETIEQWTTSTMVETTNPMWITLSTEKARLETSIAGLYDRVAKTKKRLEDLQKDLRLIPEKAARAHNLRDAVDNAAIMFEKAQRTRETAFATRDRVTGKSKGLVRTVNETTPEEARFAEPVYPNVLLFVGLGAFAGLLLGGGFAFIGEFTAASFSTANQVRYALQVPVIGEISPIMTRTEVRSRKRKRFIVWASFLILVALVVLVHYLWFDKDLRAYLPPFVRDVMRRLYGVGAR